VSSTWLGVGATGSTWVTWARCGATGSTWARRGSTWARRGSTWATWGARGSAWLRRGQRGRRLHRSTCTPAPGTVTQDRAERLKNSAMLVRLKKRSYLSTSSVHWIIKVKVHPCLDLNFAGSRQKKRPQQRRHNLKQERSPQWDAPDFNNRRKRDDKFKL
jgi:hypothetical protein